MAQEITSRLDAGEDKDFFVEVDDQRIRDIMEINTGRKQFLTENRAN